MGWWEWLIYTEGTGTSGGEWFGRRTEFSHHLVGSTVSPLAHSQTERIIGVSTKKVPFLYLNAMLFEPVAIAKINNVFMTNQI